MFLSHEGQNLKTFVGLILWLIMFVWTFVGMEKIVFGPNIYPSFWITGRYRGAAPATILKKSKNLKKYFFLSKLFILCCRCF